MDAYYSRFLKLNISLEPLGILPWGQNDETCFCTPAGAHPIGRTGVDGVHYCFVQGYGSTVFAVSPSNEPGEYVHPVARSFEEFLGLLAACRGEAALEQSWMWDRAEFEGFLKEDEPDPGWQETVKALEDGLGVTPEQDPWACLQEIRAEVDCTGLCLPAEHEELPPCEEELTRPWEVRFRGREGRPGTELALHKWITWADREWYIPSIYSCGKGLVVDFCLKTSAEQVQAWMDKWGLNPQTEDGAHLTEAEQEQVRRENPMSFEFRPKLVLNGTNLEWSSGSGGSWSGCLPGFEQCPRPSDQAWMKHYELSRDCCWSFFRYSFPWKTSRRVRKFKMLFLAMEQERVERRGEPFTVEKPGDRVMLTNPADGHLYQLDVVDYHPEQVDIDFGDGRSYPNQCRQLDYTITPPLSGTEFRLDDCAPGDRPVSRAVPNNVPFEYLPDSQNDVLALIGGEDGPSAVCMAVKSGEGMMSACSAMHFELPECVRWQPVFMVREYPQGAFQLI